MNNVTIHWIFTSDNATSKGTVDIARETEAEAIEIVDGFVKVSLTDPSTVDTLIPVERVVKIDNEGDSQ